MPPPVSTWLRTGIPDQRLAQSAGTPFDATARQVLDQQVVDQQVALSQLLVNGVLGSVILVDPSSPVDVAKGDVLCRSALLTRNSAFVATAANLALAGNSVLGVALDAAAKGSRCPYAVQGPLPPELTGLPPAVGTPGLARVSPLGRAEGVPAYAEGDTPLGGVDSAGWLTLAAGGFSPAAATSTFHGSLTTTDATPTNFIGVPFSDDALLIANFLVAAATDEVGFFTGASVGATYVTGSGVLQPAVGTPLTVANENYPGPNPSFDAAYSSGVFYIVVTGLAATTITWRGRLDVVSVLT